MSIENAKAYEERLKSDEDFRKECAKRSSLDDRIEFAKENGFNFSKEELHQVKSALADEELNAVDGGIKQEGYPVIP